MTTTDRHKYEGRLNKLATQRATDQERADVESFTYQAGDRGNTSISGVYLRDEDDHTIIRIYSAGCVHEEYPIRTASIVKRESDPR
jgi:hypothetical protein